jgi:hypothetical protein
MTHFRFRYRVNGGHTKIDVYAGNAANTTHGKCGELVMRIEEWDDLKAIIEAGGNAFLTEFIDES